MHVNEDKLVLNEDKRIVVMSFACHVEVILQNYFRWNLSCHVMFVQIGRATCRERVLMPV